MPDSHLVPRYEADKGHVRFADDVVFHVRSGAIGTADGPCTCAQDEPIFHPAGYREAVPQLQLSLTDACNMGCTYCSFRDRVHADGKPVRMPMPVVRQAVDFFRREVVDDQTRYSRVDFGLAGETMLVRHLHEQVQETVIAGLEGSPVATVWSGPNVTNGTLSMDADLADQLGPPQDISLDGPREVHDRVRFYTNDRGGTYDDVRPVLDRVLARHPDMGVSSVLTAYCTDFASIFSHLYDDVGARNIYMKPVNASHDKDYALNRTTLPAFEEGYLGLVEHILDHDAAGILGRLMALSTEDYFMRFFYRVKDQTVQVYRCGAGKSGAYVDTNGRLYACAHFIGKSGWDIGHVSTGFNEERRREFADMTVDDRPGCRDCYARYACGGGCHYQAVLANGDISRPDEVKCDLIRFLVRLALRLLTYLDRHHPEVLAALPAPFGIDPALAEAPAQAAYRPVGALVAGSGAAPVRLGTPGRVRGGLPPEWDHPALLRVDDGQLTVDLGGPPPHDGELRAGVAALRLWLVRYDDMTLGDLTVRTPQNDGMLLRVTAAGAAWREASQERFRRVPHPPAVWRPAPEVEVAPDGERVRVRVDIAALAGAGALGLNLFLDLSSGGHAALAVREPFVGLSPGVSGSLRLTGPDADRDQSLLPLSRWAGLQPNVC
ncbi:radical SAM protein [Phytohabitans houttuyneae]|uniref:Radical SAM core domain-containing protein n=1 Tax=Phytohabitans houttuyneae TaxID=1076126 RepID=A0A6V8K7D5_9ACTN|nr:SPASM domain-containing protein [Phytohabitans houttuyneae]GFJ78029.1 hypothetical protein Phou_022090 [Phytohabitans houttuyneae]